MLVDSEIMNLAYKQDLISPFDPKLLNSASYDVTIGDTYIRDGEKNIEKFDSIKNSIYILKPNEFILTCTQQKFKMPDNIGGQFLLKSSAGRDGFNHTMAGFIDPGFSGILTLELKNYSNINSLKLYPGQPIGQVIFLKGNYCRHSYRKIGRYNNDQTVAKSKNNIYVYGSIV